MINDDLAFLGAVAVGALGGVLAPMWLIMTTIRVRGMNRNGIVLGAVSRNFIRAFNRTRVLPEGLNQLGSADSAERLRMMAGE